MMIKNIFDGRVLQLNLERALLPDGRSVDLEIIRHPGGACALPVHDDGNIILIRQYRHAAGGIIWELPAGRINDNEGPEFCARRELIEETGYEAGNMEKIGEFFSTPGFCTELLHIYLATQLAPCKHEPEDDEYIEIEKLPFATALQMVFSGEIKDSKTMIALLLAKDRFSKKL
ncbi:MAG: NUDIX hydrolase [Nitrospirae bacterium]|nr:NUDIX hydrolase [Nitrospirota bacterium]